jgi:hypothetical protein
MNLVNLHLMCWQCLQLALHQDHRQVDQRDDCLISDPVSFARSVELLCQISLYLKVTFTYVPLVSLVQEDLNYHAKFLCI